MAPGLRWAPPSRSFAAPAATSDSRTAGPTCATTSAWTGSSTPLRTATSRSSASSTSISRRRVHSRPAFRQQPASRDDDAPAIARLPFRRAPRTIHRRSGAAPVNTTRAARAGQRRRRALSTTRATACCSPTRTRRIPGAMIASLSIPWGESKGDEDLGGYHLVWTRDMVNSTTGLLASGNTETPLPRPHLPRVLAAARRRLPPELLDRRRAVLARHPARRGRVPDPARVEAARGRRAPRLRSLSDGAARRRVPVDQGPATPQERWEENSGYSPSTLASNIAALMCAASFRP